MKILIDAGVSCRKIHGENEDLNLSWVEIHANNGETIDLMSHRSGHMIVVN